MLKQYLADKLEDRPESILDEDFEFRFDSNPPIWQPPGNCWTAPEFANELAWLSCTQITARWDGVDRQARHAAHLHRQVRGAETQPYRGDRRPVIPSDREDSTASALACGYGEDPRPEFRRAMIFAGIEPFEASIHAAGSLHLFRVVGDQVGTKNGWAILHRCPPFGVFGSWRTGLVRTWRSAYVRDEERTSMQIEQDIATAIAARDASSPMAA